MEYRIALTGPSGIVGGELTSMIQEQLKEGVAKIIIDRLALFALLGLEKRRDFEGVDDFLVLPRGILVPFTAGEPAPLPNLSLQLKAVPIPD